MSGGRKEVLPLVEGGGPAGIPTGVVLSSYRVAMSTVKLSFHGLATLQSRYVNWQRGWMESPRCVLITKPEPENSTGSPYDRKALSEPQSQQATGIR